MKEYSWIKGFNYVPSTAHNDIEFWRDYDEVLVERELGYAKRLGLNCVRPFLSYVVYRAEPEIFLGRLRHFVQTAFRMGIRTMPVVWDSCFSEEEPKIDCRENKWFANPGSASLTEKFWPRQEGYCRALISTLRDEPGLLLWDIHNEPTMTTYVDSYSGEERRAHEEEIWRFVRHYCDYFHRNDPEHLLTVGVAFAEQLEVIGDACDVLSFHDYSPSRIAIDRVYREALSFSAAMKKPLFCSELCCTARANPYDVAIQAATEHEVGYFLWELMVGESFWNDRHGIVYPDGSIRDSAAVAAILGFFRNRGPGKPINLNAEGIVTRILQEAVKWLSQDVPDPAAGKALLQTMAYLLESGELVPMCIMPSSQAAALDSTEDAKKLVITWMQILWREQKGTSYYVN